MTIPASDDVIEDVADALRVGRPVRAHGPYKVMLGDEGLTFSPSVIEDPVPTGAQLLELAGVRPAAEFQVYQVLWNGIMESLRPDETTDLRTIGVERFIIFRTDRSFRFEMDGRMQEWGATAISGAVLKKLAGVNPNTYGVWLEVRGGNDRRIGDTEFVDLSERGVERFFTGIVQTTEG